MRNSSSLDWLRFMHTPNDYRVSRETGVTSYKSKDIYRSGFRQVLSADCFYMVMRKAQWD